MSATSEAEAIAVDLALREIERELRRHLDLGERVAIGFILERFADDWLAIRPGGPWCPWC
jgi:hypothetical protein